jgi:hypothetical protein
MVYKQGDWCCIPSVPVQPSLHKPAFIFSTGTGKVTNICEYFIILDRRPMISRWICLPVKVPLTNSLSTPVSVAPAHEGAQTYDREMVYKNQHGVPFLVEDQGHGASI